jgi:hypothetical protein
MSLVCAVLFVIVLAVGAFVLLCGQSFTAAAVRQLDPTTFSLQRFGNNTEARSMEYCRGFAAGAVAWLSPAAVATTPPSQAGHSQAASDVPNANQWPGRRNTANSANGLGEDARPAESTSLDELDPSSPSVNPYPLPAALDSVGQSAGSFDSAAGQTGSGMDDLSRATASHDVPAPTGSATNETWTTWNPAGPAAASPDVVSPSTDAASPGSDVVSPGADVASPGADVASLLSRETDAIGTAPNAAAGRGAGAVDSDAFSSNSPVPDLNAAHTDRAPSTGGVDSATAGSVQGSHADAPQGSYADAPQGSHADAPQGSHADAPAQTTNVPSAESSDALSNVSAVDAAQVDALSGINLDALRGWNLNLTSVDTSTGSPTDQTSSAAPSSPAQVCVCACARVRA